MSHLLFEIQAFHKVGLRLVEIDRAGVGHPDRALAIHGADRPGQAVLALRLEDDSFG